MSTEAYALHARAGDTFKRTLTWTEDDGTPINLTGASVEWSLAARATEYQYEDVTQASISDPIAGEITLALTPTETRALYGHAWSYEVTITLLDTTRTTILEGVLTVGREFVETVEAPA